MILHAVVQYTEDELECFRTGNFRGKRTTTKNTVVVPLIWFDRFPLARYTTNTVYDDVSWWTSHWYPARREGRRSGVTRGGTIFFNK